MKKAKKTSSKPAPMTDPITIVNVRYEPPSIAQGMDVDRIHAILRSAESGDTRDLFSLYRDIIGGDSHLQAEFGKRKLAVLGDPMSFQPQNKDVPEDVESAAAIQIMVSSCKSWRKVCAHLLESTLYPVAVVEKVFKPSFQSSEPFILDRLIPVPAHLFDFTSGTLRIYDVDPLTGSPLATSHAPDENRYIVHRGHLLSSPDCWGGPMRSILFWWLLSAMDREWWARFLDRYGSPFLLGTYDKGDHESKSVLESAFRLSVKVGGLVVSDGTRVEIKEAAGSNTGDAYEKFLSICQREKSKLILGQTLSAEAQPTGLGSGASTQQESVRQDIRKFDAAMLSETLRDQLFGQFLEINNFSGDIPALIWGSDTAEESQSMISILTSLTSAGFELDDAGMATISQRFGIGLRRRTQAPSMIPGFSAREVGVVNPFLPSPRNPR